MTSERQRRWLNYLFVNSQQCHPHHEYLLMIRRSSLPRIYFEESCETTIQHLLALPPTVTDISNILLTFLRSAISQLSDEQFHCYVYLPFAAKPRQKRAIPAAAGKCVSGLCSETHSCCHCHQSLQSIHQGDVLHIRVKPMNN